MRDEDFEVFIDEVGEADASVSVPADAIEAGKGKLPDQLLAYWQAEGWSSYAKGLFWTVNPEPKAKEADDRDFEVRTFFSARDAADGDLKDEGKRPLFQRALRELGPLASDEIYGFEPPLVAGGRLVLENLRKVKLEPHLRILRQLSLPRIPFSGADVEGLLQGR
ncbi:DUF1851 domain-containing protein [Rhizobiaceae bacterium BDR2-2]|uniref:DUF1851 domain-containing protein n=1 Tax=Ectorhizobium quercum TaxID=2965071 RepID=A0AAE3N476_9HYPH|nr:T6SS immunity protein Tdi1 domain-containing protein [Ectorhizobium quercum]MCX8999906.1 DUF1851 domain-containing protein [Ectorhizobium quercum]